MPNWIHNGNNKIAMLDGMANELTSIFITKIAVPIAPYSGGAGNFMRDSLKRGVNSNMGDGFGKVITGLGAGYGVMNAMKDEDPSGQGKSKPERLGETVGATGGLMLGSGMGSNVGNMITRKIDPTDKYMTNASHTLDTKTVAPEMRNGAVRQIKTPPSKGLFGMQIPGSTVKMDSNVMKEIEQRKLDREMKSRAGTLFKRTAGSRIPSLNTGNLGNWAKFKASRAGLGLIPGALGVAGGIAGMGLGEKLMGLPFRGLRKDPQPTPQVDPTTQPV